MAQVSYCTREQVQHALDMADSVRNNRRIDDAIRAASDSVEGLTNRHFYPILDTRYPDPNRRMWGGVLDLNAEQYELCGPPTSLVLDGTTATLNTDYYLDPEVAPHSGLRLISTSALAWPTVERTIVLTGPFGASQDTAAAGSLAASCTSSATQISLSDSSLAGVGDLLLAGSERMIVTEKEYLDTTATVSGTLAADRAAQSLTVSSGALVHLGEMLLIGAERMFVESVVGNTVTVRRAQGGTTLAAHAVSDVVYAPRLATVTRGVLGTSAASHTASDALLRNLPPALATELALALALNTVEQGKAAYARVVGSGDNARESAGRGISDIRNDLIANYGRVRIGATR